MLSTLNSLMLTNEEKMAVYTYLERNKDILKNPVIQGFFENQENVVMLASHIINPTTEVSISLEEAFKHYFFKVRFTKYLCSLIRFCDIDYHRKRTRDDQRNPLIFDSPLDEGDATVGEFLYSISTAIEEEEPTTADPNAFQQSLNNELLFFAFNRLTDKQKLIITLAYSTCIFDKEIAGLLHISQQAITKSRQTALRKMKTYIMDRQQELLKFRREGAC